MESTLNFVRQADSLHESLHPLDRGKHMTRYQHFNRLSEGSRMARHHLARKHGALDGERVRIEYIEDGEPAGSVSWNFASNQPPLARVISMLTCDACIREVEGEQLVSHAPRPASDPT